MNKIIKSKTKIGFYELTTEDGRHHLCPTEDEKGKFDKEGNQIVNIKLPKEASAICGRFFIREHLVGPNGYEFMTKDSHREGLGWRSKMTDDEKRQVADAEKLIESIKETCMARKTEKPDPNTFEGVEAALMTSIKKLAKSEGVEATPEYIANVLARLSGKAE